MNQVAVPHATEAPEDNPIALTRLCQIAAREIGRDRPLHLSKVQLWATKGRLGVRPRTLACTNTRMTTLRFYQEFKNEYHKRFMAARATLCRQLLRAQESLTSKCEESQDEIPTELESSGAV